MSVLDIFNDDLFGVVSLTDAINLLPVKPARISQMGLFSAWPITTSSVIVEEKAGLLALLPTSRRGARGTPGRHPKRTGRSFTVPHIPHHDAVLADDVQNVRAFGSESITQTVAGLVNDKLTLMRQNHEVTEEYHAIGALHGLILDSDGATTIYDLFTEFDLVESTVDFGLDDAGIDVRLKILETKRAVEDALGSGVTYDHIHAFCGEDFFDLLISHPDVLDAYARYQNGAMLRNDPRSGFEFAGVIFEEYRGTVSGVSFMSDTTTARFFPVGAQNLFVTYYAPADYIETVNTPGKPVYAKQERMKFDKGIEIETQSNPLKMCTRPGCLVKGYY